MVISYLVGIGGSMLMAGIFSYLFVFKSYKEKNDNLR